MGDKQGRIEVHRSGGFAGVMMSAAADIGELSADEQRELLALLDALDAGEPPRAARPSTGGADRFQYDLVVTRDGEQQTFSLGEGDLTAAQRGVLTSILRRGRPKRE